MKTIRILFYKARIGDKHWLDDAISLWTGIFNWGTGPYAHVEPWESDKNGEFGGVKAIGKYNPEDAHQTLFKGTCVTATMRPPSKGVVSRPANVVLRNPERWDYCEIEVKDSVYEGGWNYLKARVGKKIKYAFKTIASYFLPFRIHVEDADICSELAYDALVVWQIFTKKNKCPSPRRLSRWLTKRGYVIKPLIGE